MKIRIVGLGSNNADKAENCARDSNPNDSKLPGSGIGKRSDEKMPASEEARVKAVRLM